MRCVLFVWAGALLCALCFGCRNAKIDAPAEPLEPTVQVRQLPQVRASLEGQPWYRNLMPTPAAQKTADVKEGTRDPKMKPDEGERPWVSLETTIEPLDPSGKKPVKKPAPQPGPPVTAEAAQADAQVLLEELQARIEEARRENSSWCLLRLDLNAHGKGKKAGLRLTVDVGWTDLYVVRPEILFDQLRFEDCMNRLARMARVRYAQENRWGNPLVTWRGERVSVYEAVQAITKTHGFAARFVSGGTRVTFDLARYKSRKDFTDRVTDDVIEQGRWLREKLPTMLISLAPTTSTPAEGSDKKKEKRTGGRKK